jgi:hypothetical protein
MTRKGSFLFVTCFFVCFCQAQQNPGNPYRYTATDSALAPTSLKYANPSIFKRIFMGKNYRQVWSTPIKAPVFHFSKSGLKIEELGGGQQTKSLQMADKNGRQWVLRTVDKDVTLALPKPLRHTLAQEVTQDMVSGAHPHAPLVVAHLAKALNISAPDPVLYYVASDPGFGEYDSLFANSFCFLEQREPTPDNSKTDNTEEVLQKLIKKNGRLPLQRQILKARLLDMLVADWDRHYDQWRWGQKDSAGLTWYYAIPRDRDQAFFNSGGLLVPVARLVALKHLVGFNHNTRKVRKLNYKSWSFDRFFLNELDRKDWEEVLEEFRRALPNETIAAAVRRLPPETYSISGAEAESKLVSRRDGLMKDALRYYNFISRQVTYNGTSEKEIFKITKESAGLRLTVTDEKNRKLYDRVLDKDDTRQLIINAFGGADEFIVGEDVSPGIRLIIHGGQGEDLYDINGRARTTVYEYESEKNVFRNKSRVKVREAEQVSGS